MNEPGDGHESGVPHAQQSFEIDRTAQFELTAPSGDIYRIIIALPEGDMPAGGWPSLYLLDATGSFGTCVEALRRMGRRPAATGVRPMVVVGISTPSGYDVKRRQRDYTTPRSWQPGAQSAAEGEGGASAFLDFVEQEVMPAIGQRLPCDAGQRTLCGHSLAGYFALWAMTARPGLFQACAAISPSIWWDKDALLEGAGRLAGSGARMLITVGEWEDALPPWQLGAPDSDSVRARRADRGMVTGSREVADRFAGVLDSDRVDFRIMPDDDHASIVSSAMPRVLRLASEI